MKDKIYCIWDSINDEPVQFILAPNDKSAIRICHSSVVNAQGNLRLQDFELSELEHYSFESPDNRTIKFRTVCCFTQLEELLNAN